MTLLKFSKTALLSALAISTSVLPSASTAAQATNSQDQSGPFSIHAKVRDGKMVYFQFLEDTYASARSFRQRGSWTVKTTKATPAFEVGAK